MYFSRDSTYCDWGKPFRRFPPIMEIVSIQSFVEKLPPQKIHFFSSEKISLNKTLLESK